MSLESKIEALTSAVLNLTTQLQPNATRVEAAVAAVAQPYPPAPPVVMTYEPPVAAASIPPTPPMPPLPAFAAPAPAAPAVPFTDANGLRDYAMGAYKALGPEKGAAISNVLASLGLQNMNDLQPAQYAAFFAGVEALRG